MSCFFLWSMDCIMAVESGVHARMIMVSDSGTRDRDRRLSPMFSENEVLSAKTRRNSLRDARAFGVYGFPMSLEPPISSTNMAKPTSCWLAVTMKDAGTPTRSSATRTLESRNFM